MTIKLRLVACCPGPAWALLLLATATLGNLALHWSPPEPKNTFFMETALFASGSVQHHPRCLRRHDRCLAYVARSRQIGPDKAKV